jgi:hypothetical protein
MPSRTRSLLFLTLSAGLQDVRQNAAQDFLEQRFKQKWFKEQEHHARQDACEEQGRPGIIFCASLFFLHLVLAKN